MSAWRGDSLGPEAGVEPLPPACVAELDALAARLQADPLPTLALETPTLATAMPAARALMQHVRRQLDEGLGFALLDRLPVRRWGAELSAQVFFVLMSLLSQPVAQKFSPTSGPAVPIEPLLSPTVVDGTFIYSVRDTGRPVGNGVRPDSTNLDQNLHTDNAYNLLPPRFVSLLCLRQAARGGVSQLVSFETVHELMRARRPDLVGRLFEDFTIDRQREHDPTDTPVLRRPLFTRSDGPGGREGLGPSRMPVRVQIENGYALAGGELDARGEAALDALLSVMEQDGLAHTMKLEEGQIQIVDNGKVGHKRTAFVDNVDVGDGEARHLLRIWMRDDGGRSYHGRL